MRFQPGEGPSGSLLRDCENDGSVHSTSSNNIRPLNGDAADTNTGHCHRGRWGTVSSDHHTVQQYHRQIKYLCAQRIYQVYMMIMFH